MLELQGETVLRCKPIIGYLHTGMEKTGERLTVHAGRHQRHARMVSPIANELVFSMATEAARHRRRHPRVGGVDVDVSLGELSRMASHLLFLATNGMDLGAVSMMIYGWRVREEVLRFLQKVTGLRMNHNFIRPGGVAADLPPAPSWRWRARRPPPQEREVGGGRRDVDVGAIPGRRDMCPGPTRGGEPPNTSPLTVRDRR